MSDSPFDPDKDRKNIAKHGVSLALYVNFDWTMASVLRDDRKDYGEVRYQALGPIGNGLYMLVFTRRGRGIRPISLRPADPKEKKLWRRKWQRRRRR